MGTISLRDYLKQTEQLIDSGRVEDALTRCRHVLKTFPKHVDTYRMMGKAYLEAHRHGEASDLFERVLSSCPDDFVAHIGMSIIREDEENLEAAVWHMERAFEAQPSNRAVQDELRRLYEKREGYDIPKVRLTRGALARMYAHGDLYAQAISELAGALSEDPQRADLQVLLAEMYFKTNKQTEAIDVCTRLVEKLPYCLYANRVMAEILKSSGRQTEAKLYLDRVTELDPYAAETDARTTSDKVPAVRVMLETDEHGAAVSKISAEPILEPAPQEPVFEKEELPDWLSVDSGEAEVVRAASAEQPEPPSADEPRAITQVKPPPAPPQKGVTSEIPDWLRELSPQAGNTAEGARTEARDEVELPSIQDSNQIQKIAEPVAEPELSKKEEHEEQDLSWLDDLASEQAAAKEAFDSEAEPVTHLTEETKKPVTRTGALAWLDELSAPKEETSDEQVAESGEPPILESATDEVLAEEVEPVIAEPAPEAPGAEPVAQEESPDAMPDWLEELRQESEATKEQDESPAIVDAREAETEEKAGEEGPPQVEGTGTLPEWLQDLNATQQPTTELGEPIAPRPLEEAPDWLSELRPEAAEDQGPSSDEELPEETESQAVTQEGAIDWLEELGLPTVKEPSREPALDFSWVPESETQELTPAEIQESAPLPPRVKPRGVTNALQQQLAADQISADDRLERARQSLSYGKLADAADHYGHLLRRRVLLDEVITDLDAAVHRHPGDATLWQTLGDGYMRNNELRKALDCYTKAEDLL